MADDIDMANALVDAEVSRALSRLRQDGGAQTVGSSTCQECGDDIPKARKMMGFKLCVPCAQESERRKQLFANY